MHFITVPLINSDSMLFFVVVFTFIHQVIPENCVCVPFWNCDDYLDVDVYGKLCNGHFDVCCKIKCGQRQTERLLISDIRATQSRILAPANEANIAEFPWMLGILYGNSYRCGGSLIHPKVALTAAHCVQASGVYKVRAGEWDWSSREEPLIHQNRRARKIILHPRFDYNSLRNDIALIILDRPFEITDNVGVVCLPSQNTLPVSPECTVTGWGRTRHRVEGYENILKKASIPIVTFPTCERSLQRSLAAPNFWLHDSFMCAGGGAKDACKGDGGSPLVCAADGENTYEQFGIVSWGLHCGVTNAPGVYVNVAKFIDWIDLQMTRHNLDNQVYKY